jgi:branched-chain amino acid transport system permease protein
LVDLVSFSIEVALSFGIYAILALSLNLESGYTGIPNFGKALFVAGGAAVAANLTGRLAAYVFSFDTFCHGDFLSYKQPGIIYTCADTHLAANPAASIGILIFGIVVAATIGGAFGFLASFPAIRLREDYLGMLLLAVAQFFQLILSSYDPIINGTIGLLVVDPFRWAGFGATRDAFGVLAILIVAFGVFLYTERIARSPLGRTLRAVRDNERAAEAVGKNITAIRRKVIIIGSAISGMAGALYVLWWQAITPDTWSRGPWTFVPWVMVILGGAGNNRGVLAGVLAISAITTTIDLAALLLGGISVPIGLLAKGGIQYMTVDQNYLRLIAYGIALILILYSRPEGIIREKPSLTLSRSILRSQFEAESSPPSAGDRAGSATPRRAISDDGKSTFSPNGYRTPTKGPVSRIVSKLLSPVEGP